MAKTPRTTKTVKSAKTVKTAKTAKAAKTARPARTAKTAAPRATRRPKLPEELLTAIEAARGKKALDIVVLDLRKASAFTDFFLICTGASGRQVHAIADGVEMALKAEGTRPAHFEGYQRAEWVLVDYFNFVVHVFSPAARAFYSLENLWGDAVRIELPDEEPPARA